MSGAASSSREQDATDRSRSFCDIVGGRSGIARSEKMKAIRCREWGTPDVLRLEKAESPSLKPHQVRIRARAAGVNFADSLMVGGTYQVKPPFPFTPGLEAAGGTEHQQRLARLQMTAMSQREMRGAIGNWKASGGDEIHCIGDRHHGAGVEYDFLGVAAAVAQHREHPLPGLQAVDHAAGLDDLAGGVGLTAVEIGKAMGARVIAAAGGAEKLAVAGARGADELIDYRKESIRDRVRALTGGKGADVVYDPVGGDAFDQALRAVNWEARMLVIGFAAGRIQAVPANLILVKNISVIGVVWGAQAERDPALISRNLAELLRWWEARRFKPLVAKVFPLAEAGNALTALLSRRYAGKIVLQT